MSSNQGNIEKVMWKINILPDYFYQTDMLVLMHNTYIGTYKNIGFDNINRNQNIKLLNSYHKQIISEKCLVIVTVNNSVEATGQKSENLYYIIL